MSSADENVDFVERRLFFFQSYYFFLERGGCEVAETGFEAVNVDFIPPNIFENKQWEQ